MATEIVSRARYGEASWRKHHEIWRQSACQAAAVSPEPSAVALAPGRR